MPSRSVASVVVEVLEALAGAPKAGDTVRVKLASGRVVRRRVRSHLHMQAGAYTIEVNGQTFGGSRAGVQLKVRGIRDLVMARQDAEGWYVDAPARKPAGGAR